MKYHEIPFVKIAHVLNVLVISNNVIVVNYSPFNWKSFGNCAVYFDQCDCSRCFGGSMKITSEDGQQKLIRILGAVDGWFLWYCQG